MRLEKEKVSVVDPIKFDPTDVAPETEGAEGQGPIGHTSSFITTGKCLTLDRRNSDGRPVRTPGEVGTERVKDLGFRRETHIRSHSTQRQCELSPSGLTTPLRGVWIQQTFVRLSPDQISLRDGPRRWSGVSEAARCQRRIEGRIRYRNGSRICGSARTDLVPVQLFRFRFYLDSLFSQFLGPGRVGSRHPNCDLDSEGVGGTYSCTHPPFTTRCYPNISKVKELLGPKKTFIVRGFDSVYITIYIYLTYIYPTRVTECGR